MDRRRVSKIILILTKYIPHFGALYYVIYTILGFCGIDLVVLGSFMHLSLLYWIYVMLQSYAYKFCYVHRLPLYYMLANNIIIDSDYYLNIQMEIMTAFAIHSVLIGLLIFGYSFYYVKFKLNARL